MQVLNSSVARPWKLEQNTSGQASRQALRASRLWKLEQNNMTKKGPFFGPQNVRKSRRAKMGLPSKLACCHAKKAKTTQKHGPPQNSNSVDLLTIQSLAILRPGANSQIHKTWQISQLLAVRPIEVTIWIAHFSPI